MARGKVMRQYDIDYVRENYGKIPSDRIAKHLERSESTIKHVYYQHETLEKRKSLQWLRIGKLRVTAEIKAWYELNDPNVLLEAMADIENRKDIPFSIEQIELIKNQYGYIDVDEIAELLHCNRRRIYAAVRDHCSESEKAEFGRRFILQKHKKESSKNERKHILKAISPPVVSYPPIPDKNTDGSIIVFGQVSTDYYFQQPPPRVGGTTKTYYQPLYD